MKIKIDDCDGYFRADAVDLPGSPPIGNGATREMAVACLFYRLIHESTGAGEGGWLRYFKKGEPLIINEKTDVLWE